MHLLTRVYGTYLSLTLWVHFLIVNGDPCEWGYGCGVDCDCKNHIDIACVKILSLYISIRFLIQTSSFIFLAVGFM